MVLRLALLQYKQVLEKLFIDEFSDSALLTELETRLIHIHPCELLLIGDITAHTKRMLENLSSSRLSSGNYQVRFTNLDKLENKETSLFLKDFYVSAMQTSSTASRMTLCLHSGTEYNRYLRS